jgi:hypothetical protein
MASIQSDVHGRSVDLQTVSGQDVYSVSDPGTGASFQISVPHGTPQASVYATINSMPVSLPAPSPLSVAISKNVDAQDFGQALINQFAASNYLGGISGGTELAVLAYCQALAFALWTGSLYAALNIMNGMLADNSANKAACSPFVTNAIIQSYIDQVKAFLGV